MRCGQQQRVHGCRQGAGQGCRHAGGTRHSSVQPTHRRPPSRSPPSSMALPHASSASSMPPNCSAPDSLCRPSPACSAPCSGCEDEAAAAGGSPPLPPAANCRRPPSCAAGLAVCCRASRCIAAAREGRVAPAAAAGPPDAAAPHAWSCRAAARCSARLSMALAAADGRWRLCCLRVLGGEALGRISSGMSALAQR